MPPQLEEHRIDSRANRDAKFDLGVAAGEIRYAVILTPNAYQVNNSGEVEIPLFLTTIIGVVIE